MKNGNSPLLNLTLLPLDAEQRRHDLREVFNALRWLVRSGASAHATPRRAPVGVGLSADAALVQIRLF